MKMNLAHRRWPQHARPGPAGSAMEKRWDENSCDMKTQKMFRENHVVDETPVEKRMKNA